MVDETPVPDCEADPGFSPPPLVKCQCGNCPGVFQFAFVDTSRHEMLVVNTATAASLRPGDRLMLNEREVVVLGVHISDGLATIRYSAI